MQLEYFPCYHSYFKKCEKLTDQELGRLFRALMTYSETGERQELAGRESIAFDFIADDIDRAKENYADRCERNRKNVSKRYDRIPSNTTVYETYQNKNKSENKDKEEDKKEKDKRKKSFSPPTLEEVRTYCKERNSSVDPKRFFDYFEAGGWVDSKGNPVRNWKQKLLTWEAHGGKNNVHGTDEISAKAPDKKDWNLTGNYL